MALWRAKWPLLRLAIAGFLLYALIADTGARLARFRYASLPDFDYAAEIGYLRAQGRFGEALMIAEQCLASGNPAQRAAIEKEREQTLRAQSSYLRRAKDLGMGALSGRGTSLESLVGAVTADFFVVGDVRDLIIEGGRLVIDRETDEVILVLSGVGLATTVAPEVDWVPSLLKAAKRTGAMTTELSEHILRAARTGKLRELAPLFRDIRRIADKASPGGAVRLLRHAESPDDVAKLASFLERNPSGALALHIAASEGVDIVKGGGKLLGVSAEVAEQALIVAARKGDRGVAWLRTGGYRSMVRPHVLVGVLKAFWKGNAEGLAARLVSFLDPNSWWLIPLLASWIFVEVALIARRAGRRLIGPATALQSAQA